MAVLCSLPSDDRDLVLCSVLRVVFSLPLVVRTLPSLQDSIGWVLLVKIWRINVLVGRIVNDSSAKKRPCTSGH